MKINQDFKHFIIIILVATILASIFGALHNQISFSISKEFFKDFLFGNFNAYDWNIKNERVLATIVGIIGTWWFGLILGIIYAIVSLFLKINDKVKLIFKAIFINIILAFIASFIGALVGRFVPIEYSGVFMDFGTNNPRNYIISAYMNTFSYYGGIVGLFVGIIYLYKKNSAEISTEF